MDLAPLYTPNSIAIIGASRDPNKIGAQILNNLLKSNYPGLILPVNPQATVIQGIHAYPSLRLIKEKIDLCIVAIPVNTISDIIEDIIAHKVKSVIIITAGFREVDESGQKLENEIASKLNKANIPLLGPNCLGIINPHHQLNASFARSAPQSGNILFASQSGAFGTAVLDWAESHHLGFSTFISLGNKAVLNENDILEQIPKHTQLISFYLEDFKDGQLFLKHAQKITQTTPIIVLKPGGGEKTQQAIQSHTGALSSSDDVVTVALEQAGCIRAKSAQALFELTLAFAHTPELKGNNLAIVTNAGGPGIIATNAIETSELNLAELSPSTQAKLSQILPREASLHDPVDLLGDAKSQRYDQALKIVLQETHVDAVLVILTPQTATEIELTAQNILKHKKSQTKPIFCAFMGGALVEKGIQILSENNIPCFAYPENAVHALSKLWTHQRTKQNNHLPGPLSETYLPSQAIQTILHNNRQSTLNPEVVEQLLAEVHIPYPQRLTVTSHSDAWQKAMHIGTPVVMKISSPKLIHKTEQGGVILNLYTQDQLEEAYSQLHHLLTKLNAPQSFIYLQKQLPKGVEVLVGMKRDPSFGSLITVGTGGIFTEVYQDTSSLIAPFTKNQAKQMLAKTKIYQILAGARGHHQYDLEPLFQTILGLANLALTYPQIQEIDLNPFVMTEDDACALDARIIL